MNKLAVAALATALTGYTLPAQALVWGGFDTTRVNYPDGVLSGAAHDDLRTVILAAGDSVGALTGTINANYLASIDVFYTSLLTNNNVPLTAAEQTALSTWVQGGGVLVISADIFNKAGYDSFGAFVGVGSFADAPDGPFAFPGVHPLTTNVTDIDPATSVSFTYNAANTTLLITNSGAPWAAVLDNTSGYTGGGCVLVLGDHNIFTDNFINNVDNLTMATNMVGWVSSCQGLGQGEACLNDATCLSGFCVDGVCCDSACGAGATDDCQACSVAAGATTDGTCAPLAAATECRAAAGDCDVAEACDGTATTCPADALTAAGVECRASADLCDAAEVCDGLSAACPVDVVATAGTECRASAGDCDVAETCDGTTAACPADAVAAAGTECRTAAGACDAAETCDGTAAKCPVDGSAPDGTSCDDGDACTGTDVCSAGMCGGEDICGSGGAGGTGAGGSTTSTTSGSGGGGDDTVASGGCSCTAVGTDDDVDGLWLALGLALAVGRRRVRGEGSSRAERA